MNRAASALAAVLVGALGALATLPTHAAARLAPGLVPGAAPTTDAQVPARDRPPTPDDVLTTHLGDDDATPSAAYDTDAAMPAHADDIADYTLSAKLDPAAHTIHGEGTIRWRNTSAVPTREIWVHLYLNAFKNERSVFLREPVGGFRGSEPLTEWGYIDVRRLALRRDAGPGPGAPATKEESAVDLWPSAERSRPGDDDETDARVPLPREIAPGETVAFDVVWDSKLPSVLERTGFLGSFHMAGQWFPKLARLEPDGRWAHFPFHHLAEFYADYGTYDVTVDVPEAFTIGATGPVVESHTQGGRRIERHVQADVHDFAWTAWDRWASRAELIDGVKTTVLYPPGFEGDAARELAALRFSLPHFSAKYGRYPYGVLTVVHPPERASEAGGMEYPTLITTGGPWYGPPGVRVLELTAVHEYGHQYFYGLIGSDEVTWPFLDEGVNSYAETEAMQALFGSGSAVDLLGLRISDIEAQATRARMGEHDQRVAQPAFSFTTGFAYGSLVYSRSATILETIRRVWGDERLSRALGRYARKWRYKHPGPQDFERSIEDGVGPEARAALHAALFEKGWVDYVVTEVSSRKVTPAAGIYDRDGKRETVAAPGDAVAGTGAGATAEYEGWVLVTRRGTLSFPVDVELVLEDGTRTRKRWAGDAETIRLPYRGASALHAAVVDPDHAVLLDDNPTNNFATATDQLSRGAPRTLERATYWAQVLLSLVSP